MFINYLTLEKFNMKVVISIILKFFFESEYFSKLYFIAF